MPRVYAGRWVKNEATGSTRFHNRLWKKNLFGSHLLKHWRTHTLGFCREPNPISIRWLGNPNPNSLLLHYRSIPCLNTLVGSVHYLFTLLKYRLFHFIAGLYPILTHCWGIPYLNTLLSNSQKPIHCWAIPNPNTLLRYSLSYNFAEQFPLSIHTELYPILKHCWCIPYLNTLLSNSQILIHCWAIPNPITSLRYSPS